MSSLEIRSTTTESGELQHRLFCAVTSSSKQLLYDIKILDLLNDEKFLNSGRFENFTNDRLEHSVTFPYKRSSETVKFIDWIGSNISNKWNFRMEAKHVSNVLIIFHFENPADAVHFKLVF